VASNRPPRPTRPRRDASRPGRPNAVERKVRLINQNLRCNEQIRISPVRLIGPDNEQYGVVNLEEALQRSRDLGVDLVEVAPSVRPPVCRLMNYGKWKYTQKKHQKKHHEQPQKEVRLRPKTDKHDREIKIQRAIRFLKKGHKVQFTMVFRGRERAHRDIGFATFREIVEMFGPRVKIERAPNVDGRFMTMVVSPVKGAFDDVTVDESLANEPDTDDEPVDEGPDVVRDEVGSDVTSSAD
jgi:translation initiation factor IF-3